MVNINCHDPPVPENIPPKMPEWVLVALFSSLSTIMIGLQAWILTKLVAHEKQIYRLVSDAESEKGTRNRIHSDFETRLRALEHGRRT